MKELEVDLEEQKEPEEGALHAIVRQVFSKSDRFIRYTSLPSIGYEPPNNKHHVLLLRSAHVSLEQLNPTHHCESRRSSPLTAMFNLVATVCGGGVLSLPLAFRRCGIIPTTLLMIWAAVATDFTLYLLIACARRTGGRSYGDVASAAFGSVAQVSTTASVAFMLCGALIAYQVLVRDIWAPVLFTLAPDLQTMLRRLVGGNERIAENILLGALLVAALPLLLKKDLHALRYTCYVGFSSCILLMIAVVYRATQVQLPQDGQPRPDFAINWYSTNLDDYLFAFPIVALCFFCSYNALGVHGQLINPTRRRVRMVLDSSMLICFALFFLVGLGGYLYAGNETLDNILLNFAVDDKAILAGRMGYCLTLMFGLPLVLLPCREAAISVPGQVAEWKRDTALIEKYRRMADERDAGRAHLVVNGVDFDEKYPMLLADDPAYRHGAIAKYNYGSVDTQSTVATVDDLSAQSSREDKKEDESQTCMDSFVHVAATLVILAASYTAAILVPGVADVWAIFGSSMAIWIAFIVPCACYLKIREHKVLGKRGKNNQESDQGKRQ